MIAVRMQIRGFLPTDQADVIALWERCGLTRAWNDPARDIARKLTEQPELFLIGRLDDEIVSTAMVGFDGHRGWIHYLAVSPEHQQQGLGRAMVAHAEQLLHARGCPKVNLLVRPSNIQVIEFYKRIGYLQDAVVSLGRRLIADSDVKSGDDPMSPAVRALWTSYLATAPRDAASRYIETFSFTDNQQGADELASLVVGGAKRATASLLWGYEADHDPLPYPGSLSIVTDWNGSPCCVIETRRVDIVAFEDVDQVFAETEGEGDRSLRYWREAHWAFFTRECQRLGKSPTSRMPVVCERFEVVYPRIGNAR